MTNKPTIKSNPPGIDAVQIFARPNTLKAKLTGGLMNVSLSLDEELLARAEAKVESMVDDYLKWVEDDVLKLDQAHGALAQDAELGSPAHDAVIRGASDIASQGGTFGFHLLSAIGTVLQDYASALVTIDQTHVTVMKLHIDAMRVVLRQDLTGDGGEPGAELLKMLRTAAKKTA
jgi:hypothetical protein